MIYQKLTLGFVRSAPVFAALMQQPVRRGDHLEARAGEHSRKVLEGKHQGLVSFVQVLIE